MIKHIFLNKSCTITKGSEYNTGLNPISEICAGNTISRTLVNFNIDELKKLIDDKTISDLDKVKITLCMKNCGSLMSSNINETFHTLSCENKERASSFDIIAFPLNHEWDSGRGFCYEEDFFGGKQRYSTKNGCNWYKYKNDFPWDNEGVYTNEELANDYFNNFSSDKKLVISRQHFNYGNEDLSLDITDFILGLLRDEKPFYGLGLAFAPKFEETAEKTQYIGFFNNNTNTFFNPYVEIEYFEEINDDRNKFYIGKENRLYLFVSEANEPKNLDFLPTCSVDGKELEVKQSSKGAYYALFSVNNGEVEPNTLMYDKWSNLSLNGIKEDDVELEFEVLPKESFLSIGHSNIVKKPIIPSIYGINDSENIKIGEVREVFIELREKFSKYDTKICNRVEYRLYVKEADREIDVFGYQPIEIRGSQNVFLINTNDLMPNDYFIDIRVLNGREQLYFKKVLKFTVSDDVTHYFI